MGSILIFRTNHRIRSSTRRACPSYLLTPLVCCDSEVKYIYDNLSRSLCLESNNKYLEPSASTRSFLSDAKNMLDQNGSLSDAALLLEAAIQKGDLGEGGYEAWILLGETRNMDEREELGMRALVEGVKRAGAAGAAGVGQSVS